MEWLLIIEAKWVLHYVLNFKEGGMVADYQKYIN